MLDGEVAAWNTCADLMRRLVPDSLAPERRDAEPTVVQPGSQEEHLFLTEVLVYNSYENHHLPTGIDTSLRLKAKQL